MIIITSVLIIIVVIIVYFNNFFLNHSFVIQYYVFVLYLNDILFIRNEYIIYSFITPESWLHICMKVITRIFSPSGERLSTGS